MNPPATGWAGIFALFRLIGLMTLFIVFREPIVARGFEGRDRDRG